MHKRLDPNQKQAVDHIYGPLVVLAGPGTGKTHVITMRIANILRKADTQPDQILAITFTDAAAREMRSRLLELIGVPALRVKIETFHAFCNEILETYPEYSPLPAGSRHIEEMEQLEALELVLKKLPLKLLKPYGNHEHYIPMIRRNIQKLKQEGITPEQFKRNKKLDAKNKELARVYDAYQKFLRKEKLYDFDDMLLSAAEAVRAHRTLARILREQYEFILVDEHQDTNDAQQCLIELMVRGIPEPNVCVVGDEKQAIYRFQGGSMENFLYFQKKFPAAKIILLKKNFRSCQKILDAVHPLGQTISPRSGKLIASEVQPWSGKVEPRVPFPPVRVIQCPDPEVELSFVMRDIKQKINEGIAPRDIAILYRDNKDARELHRMLVYEDIRHTFETEQNIFSDPHVRNALKIIRAITHIGDERAVLEALHADCFGIEPHELYAWMLELSREGRKSVLSLDHPAIALLKSLAVENRNNNLTRTLELVFMKTGLLARTLSNIPAEEGIHMRGLQGLFDIAKEIESRNPAATCDDVLAYVERAQKHGIQLRPKQSDARPEGVVCMTAHKAKGREFGYVYIIHAYDGHWGNRTVRDHLPLAGVPTEMSNPDEMRLLYVACTRAKNSLTISYPHVSFSGREALPTRFLELLDKRRVSYISFPEFVRTTRLSLKVPTRLSLVDNNPEKDLFLSILRHNGLSVTGLNNFLDCSWKFIYTNLLRIPKTKTKWEQFGTAVHAALRDFFAKKSSSRKYLIDRFKYHLDKQPMQKDVYKELLKKGIAALGAYFDAHPDGWHKKYLLEYARNDVDTKLGVTLNGKLDKIELLPKNEVRIIDYKTGHPKSRNEIMGKTKTSTGGIFRQLVFYKLLLDSLPATHGSSANWRTTTHYSMQAGVIEFIESDPFRSESFTIEKTDIDTLKKEIKTLITTFEKGTYENFACHKKDCEFCELRATIEKTIKTTS
ncbi:hypothetical protein A2755_00265 [Candidatus Wolfebacteria bacterium RIFCSPHIGHO2_01_FULL_48_22]|uniref:DNA 3'-5' helicase n=1 Tax=Candidatus Wolfebacteria bacterium RIFCSPHIGHO2_01_FULL_48_22 TaxID=1802555 RepID=A0A1F8DVS6_9BACT|nr:MAG: hypothetical protein A2755_00265 [Candidatus Wolfebacteria bacterium RIFCSPHIGHO2_01_FULL_48_22]